MPRGFENALDPCPEIWSPEQQYNPATIRDANSSEWGNRLSLVGRTRPGTGDFMSWANILVKNAPRALTAIINQWGLFTECGAVFEHHHLKIG
jgi:hypothetical protein